MTLLHLLWSGGVGGAERSVYQLLRAQLEENWEDVGIFFADASGPYADRCRELGCRIESAAPFARSDPRFVPTVVRRLARYDVHHFHSVEPLLWLASIASGRKVRVFTERGGSQSFMTARKRIRYGVAGPLLRTFFHGYSGNTRHAAAVAAHRYGLPPDRVSVTYNGLELELLAPRRARGDVRASLGIPESAFVVGSAAYLKEWKRIDWVLLACAEVDVDATVLVVGDGPDRPRLEALARDLGISHRVVVTGVVDHPADYLAAMDAFALPSNGVESFGNAVVEAMALGVPSIVAADSPGVREHVRDEETGFVAAGPPQLSTILERLSGDDDLRRRIGERAAEYVQSTYTPARMAAAYRRLYGNAIAAASTRSRI